MQDPLTAAKLYADGGGDDTIVEILTNAGVAQPKSARH